MCCSVTGPRSDWALNIDLIKPKCVCNKFAFAASGVVSTEQPSFIRRRLAPIYPLRALAQWVMRSSGFWSCFWLAVVLCSISVWYSALLSVGLTLTHVSNAEEHNTMCCTVSCVAWLCLGITSLTTRCPSPHIISKEAERRNSLGPGAHIKRQRCFWRVSLYPWLFAQRLRANHFQTGFKSGSVSSAHRKTTFSFGYFSFFCKVFLLEYVKV